MADSSIFPRISTLLYLIILPLYEERGFFQVLLSMPVFSLLVLLPPSVKRRCFRKQVFQKLEFWEEPSRKCSSGMTVVHTCIPPTQ